MDIKEISQQNKEASSIESVEPTLKPPKEVFIRTMQRDIAALEGKSLPPLKFEIKLPKAKEKEPVKTGPVLGQKVPPPAGLPVVKPGKGPKKSPLTIPSTYVPPATEPSKLDLSKLDFSKFIPSLSFLSFGWLGGLLKAKGQKERLRYALIALAGIFIIVVMGGFFYWWEYVREVTPPPPITHLECRDFQCVSVEGEGTDQCQTDEACEPPEPKIPDALFEVDEIETIEIEIGDEDLLINKLKSIALKIQTQDTFKQVLVKLVGQKERKYADFETLIEILEINLPESILNAITPSQIGGENYTLFFYSQEEGNRLGLIMDLEDGLDLVFKLWEDTMVDDLRTLHLTVVDKPAATEEFLNNIHGDVAIRYINFPEPGLSIDYAIIDGKLAIATSRESMWTLIDTILGIEPEATTTEEIIITEEATTTEATTTEVLE